MDDTLRNQTPERRESSHDAGNHSPSPCNLPNERTSPATRPAEPSTVSNDVVTICAWCPELHILQMERREVDVVVTIQIGKDPKSLQVIRNGKELRISHGICVPCRERLKA